MAYDAQGLILSTNEGNEAGAAYRFAIDGYLYYKADLGARLATLLAEDPGFAMAHVLAGYFAMMPLNALQLHTARQALAKAEKCAVHATHRERSHVAALAHWIDGDLDRALSVWEEILAAYPRDLLALRVHHNTAFWYGLPQRMLHEITKIMPSWSNQRPGYSTLLACQAFALEECGQYDAAEKAGWSAIEADPGNLWATHALTHVMEMQGRREEGIAFLNQLEPHWETANNFKHHLWWHRAMFHHERREFDQVLDLYDQRFRDISSPLLKAVPDLYNDVLNATSMLFRLQLHGITAGNRWDELADLAEARIGDTLATLTLPHWMMVLVGAERWQAAERLLQGINDAGSLQRGERQQIIKDVALPVSRAVLFHGRQEYLASVQAMRPALHRLQRLGGSHAQRDVFEQLFVDAAMKSGQDDVLRLYLDRARATHPVEPLNRIGYAMAARRVGMKLSTG
ncbi:MULTISPECIES: tetratricopeptide repeat protein [unclassified Caballeronia]|uniref:tetratricopeptide repeat protein n=1 Tax=unclassified Caballeronia TaxID=2646786 RepID=UPI003ECE9B8E